MVKTARLAAVSALVPPSEIVIDVGSDHALLGIDLIKSNRARFVINVEKAPGPLQAGIANVKKAGLAGLFEHVLSDGFSNYDKARAVDTIVLAGFGGQNMVNVLRSAGVAWKQLVVQPSNNAQAIRRFASDNHLAIDAEQVVFDGRFYELVRITKKQGRTLSNKEMLFGPVNLKLNEPTFKACWSQRLAHLQRQNRHANTKKLADEIQAIEEMLQETG